MSEQVPDIHSVEGRTLLAAMFFGDKLLHCVKEVFVECQHRIEAKPPSQEDADFELEIKLAAVNGLFDLVKRMHEETQATLNSGSDAKGSYLALAQQMLLFGPEKTGQKVYFQSDGEYVKIGRTIRSEGRRLKENQTGNPRPLTTLIVIPNGCEKKIQARFKADHFRGEWYRMSPDLNDFIRSWQMVEVAF